MSTEAPSGAPGQRRLPRRLVVGALVLLALTLVAATVVWAFDGARGFGVKPSAIHFGDQDVAELSRPQTVTVTNQGGVLTIASVGIVGENARDFVVTDASTCVPGPLEQDDSCTILVRFGPIAVGAREATLSVMGLASGTTVSLAGTGVEEGSPS